MTAAAFTCGSCAAAVPYVDTNGDGGTCGCADSNPQERAAIALRGIAPMIPWEEAGDAIRARYRGEADKALRAAIDVEELAEHIGPIHADVVRIHFLGGAQ